MSYTPSSTQAVFLNTEFGPIGKVLVTQGGNPGPGIALCLESKNGQRLDVGHFLAIPTPDGAVSFAVTLEPDVRSDLNTDDLIYENDLDELMPEPMTARPIARAWKLAFLGNTVGTSRPMPIAPIYFANRRGVEFALGLNRIPENLRIPIGLLMNGDGLTHPLSLHAEYLLGPQGVHLNWGGVSGLSGKTSKKALCELALLSQRQTLGVRVAVVVFATKGTDELFRDLPAAATHPYWQAHPEKLALVSKSGMLDDAVDQELYAQLGLETAPFDQVRLCVPYGDDVWWGYRTPETNGELGTAEIRGFQWDLRQLAPYLSLFASTDSDDKLRSIEADVLKTIQEGYWAKTEAGQNEKRQIHTLADLENFFEVVSADLDDRRRWKGHHVETIARAKARYLSIFQRARQVVTPETVKPESVLDLRTLADGATWVIDLTRLKEEARLLVFYKVLTELYDLMQSNQLPLDRLLIDVDELNQLAPYRTSNPATRLITAKLQDIAERGRTDGLILLTAQQTLSDVDDRIESNIATRFYGMMGMQEARQALYSFSELERYVVTNLEPWEMLVQHPILKYRVKVRVPRSPFLRGKDGQALLSPATTVNAAERLQKLLAGRAGRAVPAQSQIEVIMQEVLTKGGTLDDLRNTAQQVGQVPPLEGTLNTARATVKLWLMKLNGLTPGVKDSIVLKSF